MLCKRSSPWPIAHAARASALSATPRRGAIAQAGSPRPPKKGAEPPGTATGRSGREKKKITRARNEAQPAPRLKLEDVSPGSFRRDVNLPRSRAVRPGGRDGCRRLSRRESAAWPPERARPERGRWTAPRPPAEPYIDPQGTPTRGPAETPGTSSASCARVWRRARNGRRGRRTAPRGARSRRAPRRRRRAGAHKGSTPPWAKRSSLRRWPCPELSVINSPQYEGADR